MAGVRIDPPPSDPTPNGAPAATAAAVPPLLPPGDRDGSHGLRVGPNVGDSVNGQIVISGTFRLADQLGVEPADPFEVDLQQLGGRPNTRRQHAGLFGGSRERRRCRGHVIANLTRRTGHRSSVTCAASATTSVGLVGGVDELGERLGQDLAFAQPPGGSFDVDDGGAVEEPVQDCGWLGLDVQGTATKSSRKDRASAMSSR